MASILPQGRMFARTSAARRPFARGQRQGLRPGPSLGVMPLDMSLDRKTALVTGAGKGSGEGIARVLAEQGAALVGIDSVNIDDMADASRPAHTALLKAGIPIVEHLRGLEALPPEGFRFHAAPPPIEGMGTFPVRAYAVIGA